jgi:beta-phosphoglucomutase
LAIATTAPKKNWEFVLKALDIKENIFSAILGDEDIKKGKPDPEIYLKTAKKLKVRPKECLVFEDSPVGVEAAKNAGMTVIGMLTKHTKEELKIEQTIKNYSVLTISTL